MSPTGLTIGADATFMGCTHSCSDQEKVLCFVIYSKVRTEAKSGKTHRGANHDSHCQIKTALAEASLDFSDS